jgi:hypothetical protein
MIARRTELRRRRSCPGSAAVPVKRVRLLGGRLRERRGAPSRRQGSLRSCSTRSRAGPDDHVLADGDWHKASDLVDEFGITRQSCSHVDDMCGTGEIERDKREYGAQHIRFRDVEMVTGGRVDMRCSPRPAPSMQPVSASLCTTGRGLAQLGLGSAVSRAQSPHLACIRGAGRIESAAHRSLPTGAKGRALGQQLSAETVDVIADRGADTFHQAGPLLDPPR